MILLNDVSHSRKSSHPFYLECDFFRIKSIAWACELEWHRNVAKEAKLIALQNNTHRVLYIFIRFYDIYSLMRNFWVALCVLLPYLAFAFFYVYRFLLNGGGWRNVNGSFLCTRSNGGGNICKCGRAMPTDWSKSLLRYAACISETLGVLRLSLLLDMKQFEKSLRWGKPAWRFLRILFSASPWYTR